MVSFSLIIFCVTLLINSISCYLADTRLGHNSVLIHDRLLVFGGWKNSTNSTRIYTSSEIFYLDLTKQFDSVNQQWNLILEGNLPVYEYFSTALVSTLDDDIIYLIGGYMINITTGVLDTSNLIYTYNYSSTTWTPLKVNNAITREEISGVIDDKGIIYIHGGNNFTNYTTFWEYQGKLYNDMQILNVSSTVWTKLNIFHNIPLPCSAYTANLLTNGIIVYLGGFESETGNYTTSNLTLSSMKILKLFDTKKSEWSQMNVTGDTIDPRVYHSSVLTPDGNIILFGGVGKGYQPVNPKIALLNTNKDIYEWSIPSSSSPPLLFGHSANLYGNYMIVLFGCNLETRTMNSEIYLFDVYQRIWVTTYTPPPTTATSKPKRSSPLALGLGLGIGGFVLIGLVIVGIIFYKKNKTKSPTNPTLKIAGSSEPN